MKIIIVIIYDYLSYLTLNGLFLIYKYIYNRISFPIIHNTYYSTYIIIYNFKKRKSILTDYPYERLGYIFIN